jgi:hypothetical protein
VSKHFRQLSRSTTSRWDRFWYTVVWGLGSLQQLVLRRCIRQHVWRSFDGVVNTPATMTDRHLVNTIRYCERNMESDRPIYAEMVAERDRRKLTVAN